MKDKFKLLYLGFDKKWTIAQIEGEFYSVIGNSGCFKISSLKRDWGLTSKFGKKINLPCVST